MKIFSSFNSQQAYMRHKQFPKPLRKRVRIFFSHKFSEHYYKEDNVFESLSGYYCIYVHVTRQYSYAIKILQRPFFLK